MHKAFERAIESFLSEMRRVDVPAEEFREALRYAREEIDTEIQASEECDS